MVRMMFPNRGWSWVGKQQAQDIDGKDVGKATALHEEITISHHIGQHVDQIGNQTDDEHHSGDGGITQNVKREA